MSERTTLAVVMGTVLGAFAGYFVASAGYAAFVVLGFWVVVAPLIVCLVANQRIILVGMIPNTVLVLVGVVVIQIEHPNEPLQILGFIGAIAMISLLSLPISVPIYLIRKYLMNKRGNESREGKA